jgi:hypothetical protein
MLEKHASRSRPTGAPWLDPGIDPRTSRADILPASIEGAGWMPGSIRGWSAGVTGGRCESVVFGRRLRSQKRCDPERRRYCTRLGKARISRCNFPSYLDMLRMELSFRSSSRCWGWYVARAKTCRIGGGHGLLGSCERRPSARRSGGLAATMALPSTARGSPAGPARSITRFAGLRIFVGRKLIVNNLGSRKIQQGRR